MLSNFEQGDLVAGMDACVCTSRPIHPDWNPEEALVSAFEGLLHGGGIGLVLPAMEKIAVVLKIQAES